VRPLCLTGEPHLSAQPRAPTLPRSLAAQWTQPVGASSLRPLALPLSLSLYFVGPVRQRRTVAPACPLLSLYVVGPPYQIRLPHALRGSARAHSRTSPDFSATTPAHVPNSLLIAPPVPRAHPSPHFAHSHPLSHSALAASRRQRPAPASPAIQLAGVCAKPPRAPPLGETPIPVPNFPYCALCSSNFALADVRPRRSTVLARWPADSAQSSSPE
jgi:hypothetical protein